MQLRPTLTEHIRSNRGGDICVEESVVQRYDVDPLLDTEVNSVHSGLSLRDSYSEAFGTERKFGPSENEYFDQIVAMSLVFEQRRTLLLGNRRDVNDWALGTEIKVGRHEGSD